MNKSDNRSDQRKKSRWGDQTKAARSSLSKGDREGRSKDSLKALTSSENVSLSSDTGSEADDEKEYENDSENEDKKKYNDTRQNKE